jgi:2-isopropylmalate synthase
MNGARQIECTINGLGERAGNASLEEVVMALKTRKDFYGLDTGIKTEEIYKASKMVSRLTGMPVQPNKAIVGANAFAHASGIHQDAILKNETTFGIMTPQSIGIPGHELVLTSRSGRHALAHRLEELGYKTGEAEMTNVIYPKFLEIADKKKEVFDDDLITMMTGQGKKGKDSFHLESIYSATGSSIIPTTTVELSKAGQKYVAAATGDGPVDATYKAINEIVKADLILIDYQIKSVTKGEGAQGEVTIRTKKGDVELTARGISTDIIEASAKAYLNALGKFENMKGKK